MSETTPIKTEPEEDEENGRVTPVRKSVQEYEQSLEGGDGAEKLVAPSVESERQETISNAKDKEMTLQFNQTSQVAATEDLSQVIVKHEPQDLADLEQTMARIDGPTNDEANEDDRVTPLPGNIVESDGLTTTDNTNQHPPPTPPRISVLSTSLLRVKPEFSAAMHTMQEETPAEYSSLPQDFFDGIMSDDIPDTPAAVPIIEPKKETIPSDFFDDLLVDKIQERVEAAETQDLEIKFSDRLKQLEELERRLAKEKKKHKKSKKKSRKRDRSPSHSPRRHGSRSPTPTQRRHKSRSRSPIRRRYTRSPSPSRRRLANRSPSPSDRRSRKIMRWPQESQVEDRMDAPSTSRRSHEYRDEDKRRIKTEAEKPQRASPEDVEFNEDELSENMQPHLPELGGEITVKQKRDRVIVRAKTLLNYLKVTEMEKDKPLSTFLYTSIVRKLPASHSYRNQHIYENRSPLHNVNNVSYKFNSHIRRFNLEEWGLVSLPPVAANVAKLVGCDAQAIHNQLKVIKIPAKIRKIKGEPLDEDEEAELLQSGSSLFCNAFTQTDDVVDVVKHKSQGFDIEIQAVPQTFDIACQTLETESPSNKLYDNNDDLPIMAIMREMNDSQLMALHDFAELLKETASNAMDMYRLRQRMLDIYKSAQQPSALDPSPSVPTAAAAAVAPTGVNRYSSNESSPSSRIRHTDKSSGFRINSVEGGDGTYFSVNDPRGNFVGSRNRNGGGQFNRNMSNRNMVPSESHRDFNNPQRNQESANAPKFYGRGGLRR